MTNPAIYTFTKCQMKWGCQRGGKMLGTKWIREYLSFSKTNLCWVTMLCWGSQLEKSDRGSATQVHQSHLFQVSSFFTSQGDIYLEYTCKVQQTDWMVQCFIIFHTLMIQYDRKKGDKKDTYKKQKSCLFSLQCIFCKAQPQCLGEPEESEQCFAVNYAPVWVFSSK